MLTSSPAFQPPHPPPSPRPAAAPAPSSGAPSEKQRRFDRQLRIWGEHGQARLEEAHVCLVNCGPTGTETLKNLVLGGIGAFTVVDAGKVEARDLGNNFLVSRSDVGAPRAAAVCATLHELNEAVEGNFVEEGVLDLLEKRPDFFGGFQLVVATQLTERTLQKLEGACRSRGVALLAARSYGLLGSLRASKGEHCVVEAKPDSEVEDLRLSAPWPALLEYAHGFDLGSLDDATHAHVPFAIVLIQAMRRWRDANGGRLPTTSAEKREVKAAISEMGRRFEQENIKEAVGSAYKSWTEAPVPAEVLSILKHAKTAAAQPGASKFFVLAAALGRFMAAEGGGKLPLEGSIPDMTSTTEFYLRLQHIYQAKAREDAEAVLAHARAVAAEGAGTPEACDIDYETARLFCKNAHHLAVVRYRTLAEETSADSCRAEELGKLLAAEDTAVNANAYLLLRAADRFHESYNRLPGAFDDEIDEDVSRLKAIAASLLADCYKLGNNTAVDEDLLCEVVRYGGAELHAMASVMGGIAAQEAIKLITAQFVPLAGTLIYNAISSTSTVLSL